MSETKECNRCGETKPLEDFNRNSASPDGRRPGCRPCERDRFRNYYRENKAEVDRKNRKRARARRKDPEVRRTERRKKRERYQENAERIRRARRQRMREEPHKERARWELKDAVRRGDVEPAEECEDCGHDFSFYRREAHHDDYSKPLDVAWLCALCHGKRHRIGAAS